MLGFQHSASMAYSDPQTNYDGSSFGVVEPFDDGIYSSDSSLTSPIDGVLSGSEVAYDGYDQSALHAEYYRGGRREADFAQTLPASVAAHGSSLSGASYGSAMMTSSGDWSVSSHEAHGPGAEQQRWHASTTTFAQAATPQQHQPAHQQGAFPQHQQHHAQHSPVQRASSGQQPQHPQQQHLMIHLQQQQHMARLAQQQQQQQQQMLAMQSLSSHEESFGSDSEESAESGGYASSVGGFGVSSLATSSHVAPVHSNPTHGGLPLPPHGLGSTSSTPVPSIHGLPFQLHQQGHGNTGVDPFSGGSLHASGHHGSLESPIASPSSASTASGHSLASSSTVPVKKESIREPRSKRAKVSDETWEDQQQQQHTASAAFSPAPKRRSAAVAARAIKAEMLDAFEPTPDDDDGDAMPGSANRKRKRGEQQKAKHNVAEKRRRVEMNDAMDRIKACLSQGDRLGEDGRGAPTKVSLLMDTADHMEHLQRENDRLTQKVQALSARLQILEAEAAAYRGESDDTSSLVSSPGTDSRSPRSRLALSLTSATLLTILFCIVWSPAANLIHSHVPVTVALSRTLMETAEASSFAFFFSLLHLITENVLPTITFFISLLLTLYAYSVVLRPIIRDKDLIAAHLETVTAIHGARVHSGKSAWAKALKLSQELGIKPPSSAMAVPHIIYEILRWVAVNLWLGVFIERAVYFIRGVSPAELDKNSELEVSLTQCLVELCPDADWSIAAVMLRSLNLCTIAPNLKFGDGASAVPLYKVKLWAFGAQRLLTHFSWPYRLLAWYCTRRMNKFSRQNKDRKAALAAKDTKLIVDFPATNRAQRRNHSDIVPDIILGRTDASSPSGSNTASTSVSAGSEATTPLATEYTSANNSSSGSAVAASENASTTSSTNSALSRSTDQADAATVSTNPTYVVSTQDDATLFNVMMPAEADKDIALRSSKGSERRSVETTYRSVCLVHEIAAHMLAGRMDVADTALAELVAIRSQNLPIVSRVSLDSLHTTHIVPFTRWGTLRTQLLRALVQGIQGKYTEAVKCALFVQQEAEAGGDVETRCAAVLQSTHFMLEAGHVDGAAKQLSQLLMDRQAVSCLMSDAQQYAALRATWILLEANDVTRDRVIDGVDFVVDERFIIELKHFVNNLETRRDHRFETLYYLSCVVEAALDAWQRLEAVISASGNASANVFAQAAREAAALLGAGNADSPAIPSATNPVVVSPADSARRAMLLDQRASAFLNLKLLTRRAVDLLGQAARTGTFFVPGFHFFNAKLMLLTQGRATPAARVQKELATSLAVSLKHGKWSRESLEQAIEQLNLEVLRPLSIRVQEEGSADLDLDEPPTARTCS